MYNVMILMPVYIVKYYHNKVSQQIQHHLCYVD